MTPEEIVKLIGNIANRSDIKAVQLKQIKEIKELILEEREACAKIADECIHSPGYMYKMLTDILYVNITARHIAQAIRVRGSNNGPQ